MASTDPSALPITDGTLQRIRELLKPDFARASAGKLFKDGKLMTDPVIAAQAQFVTSTGAFGTYAISFAPVVFRVAPTVVASCNTPAFSTMGLINITAVTLALFQFNLAMFTPGLVAVPNGTTVLVEWLAVGA